MNAEELMKEEPKELWLVEINGRIQKMKTGQVSVDDCLHKIKVIRRTNKGWRGESTKWEGYERVWLSDHYHFFATKKEALNCILTMTQERRVYLSEMMDNCDDLISRIIEERNNAAD